MEDDRVMKRINERKATEEIKDESTNDLSYFKAPFPLLQNIIEIVHRKCCWRSLQSFLFHSAGNVNKRGCILLYLRSQT
jgi:hypothetical protein